MEKDKINNSDMSSKEKNIEDTKNLDDKKNIKEDSEKIRRYYWRKIKDLEDKLTRTFAEMKSKKKVWKRKRRCFWVWWFSFAKALNLIDNLERSKSSLENDETLKNTDTLKNY